MISISKSDTLVARRQRLIQQIELPALLSNPLSISVASGRCGARRNFTKTTEIQND